MRINDGVLVRYELSDSGDVVDVQHGVFEFYKRISTLYIDLDAQDDYEAILIEAQLLAYTDDSFIIEWKSDDECYRALFKRLDLSVLERKGAEIKLGAMLAEAGELNADTVAELIVGSWVGDTRLEYDSNEYASISHVDAICAVYYSTPYPPGFGGQYIFNPDGTLINIVEVEYPPFEEVTYTYTWCYDVDTNRMTIVDSSNNSRDYTIIALSDKWLFVDYELEECDTQTGEVVTKYLRDGYRRITE